MVGHESPPELLETARNTIWAVNADNSWHPNNGFCLAWPPAGRIVSRQDGQKMLDAASAAIRTVAYPNYWPDLGGGANEALHSMLMQSHESCIRVFPGWPAKGSASFRALRARGGFLVTANQTAGTVGDVTVLSEVGRTLSFCLPPGWAAARVTCGGRAVTPTLTNATFGRYRVPTKVGEECTLKRLKTDDNFDDREPFFSAAADALEVSKDLPPPIRLRIDHRFCAWPAAIAVQTRQQQRSALALADLWL